MFYYLKVESETYNLEGYKSRAYICYNPDFSNNYSQNEKELRSKLERLGFVLNENMENSLNFTKILRVYSKSNQKRLVMVIFECLSKIPKTDLEERLLEGGFHQSNLNSL